MHGCLGAPLARLEAKVALEEALPALGDYTIAGPPERYRTTPNMYVWDHLHLSFPVAPGIRHRSTSRPPHVTREFEADVRVESKQEVADGVVALTLRQIADGPLPRWSPGAHVDLILDGVPARQYSLCGDPADPRRWRLGILRDADGGGGSRFVHDQLRAGEVVRVRGPRNNFGLIDSSRYLFIAGGIGITPILPMIAAAHSASARLAAPVRRAPPGLDGLPRRTRSLRRPRHGGAAGRNRAARSGLAPGHSAAGHSGLLLRPRTPAGRRRARCRAWPPRSLRVERFSARPLAAPVRAGAFEVELARSELTLTIPPDRSILDVVEEAGVGVLSSCAEGTCGTCETAVLDGLPDHRDSVLTEEERRRGLHDDLRLPLLHRASGLGSVAVAVGVGGRADFRADQDLVASPVGGSPEAADLLEAERLNSSGSRAPQPLARRLKVAMVTRNAGGIRCGRAARSLPQRW